MLTAVDPDGTSTFTYDALNRIATVNQPFGLGLTYTYDAADNRTLVQDSKGGTLTSTYDAANRLTARQFSGNSATLRYNYNYSDRNEITKITRFSDTAGSTTIGWTSLTYDAKGRITNIKHRDSSDTSLQNTTYTYDDNDRMTTKVLNGTTTTYTYDYTDQLTNDTTATYTYDANGNRTMTGYQTGAGNQTTNDGTWTYTYDDAGNRTKKSKGASLETWTYGYDHHNQLIWVEKRATDGGTLLLRVENKFDALWNRIERTADNNGDGQVDNTERFGFDGAHTWADLDGSNNLLYRRVYGDTIDSVIARISSGGTVVWYLTDHQNSVTGLVNSSGSLLGYISYDGFGNIISDTSGSNKDRFLYAGGEVDGATGLALFWARYYDAALGKWISMDPIGFNAGDANLYRYVANNTMTNVDPFGLEDKTNSEPAAKLGKPEPLPPPKQAPWGGAGPAGAPYPPIRQQPEPPTFYLPPISVGKLTDPPKVGLPVQIMPKKPYAPISITIVGSGGQIVTTTNLPKGMESKVWGGASISGPSVGNIGNAIIGGKPITRKDIIALWGFQIIIGGKVRPVPPELIPKMPRLPKDK